MAFNEEANIRLVLEGLINQRLYSCEIIEIVVVASGCTDSTEKIVESIAKSNTLVKLLAQEKREGTRPPGQLSISREFTRSASRSGSGDRSGRRASPSS